jgi:hypothetical protein
MQDRKALYFSTRKHILFGPQLQLKTQILLQQQLWHPFVLSHRRFLFCFWLVVDLALE